jgi:hypothetical protein
VGRPFPSIRQYQAVAAAHDIISRAAFDFVDPLDPARAILIAVYDVISVFTIALIIFFAAVDGIIVLAAQDYVGKPFAVYLVRSSLTVQ